MRSLHERDWLFHYRTYLSPIAVRKCQRVAWRNSLDYNWRVAPREVSIHGTKRKYLWNFWYAKIHQFMWIIIINRVRDALECHWTIVIELTLVLWAILCNGLFSMNLIKTWTVFDGCWILESNWHHFLQWVSELLHRIFIMFDAWLELLVFLQLLGELIMGMFRFV